MHEHAQIHNTHVAALATNIFKEDTRLTSSCLICSIIFVMHWFPLNIKNKHNRKTTLKKG